MASEENKDAGEMVTMLKERASIYFKACILSIKWCGKCGSVPTLTRNLLFNAADIRTDPLEIFNMKDEAQYFISCLKMQKGQNLEALAAFKQLRCPM